MDRTGRNKVSHLDRVVLARGDKSYGLRRLGMQSARDGSSFGQGGFGMARAVMRLGAGGFGVACQMGRKGRDG